MTTEYVSSILLSVKKNLGIAAEYTHFDADIISHINSSLAILFQEGVGPQDKAVKIKDDTSLLDRSPYFVERKPNDTIPWRQ